MATISSGREPDQCGDASPDGQLRVELARTLDVLCDRGSRYESRAIPPRGGSGHPTSRLGFYPDGAGDLVAFALEQERAGCGVYLLTNPIQAGQLRTVRGGKTKPTHSAGDEHVLRRRWLLIDCDPRRPPDVMATDAERQAARELADAVLGDLDGLGVRGIVEADSGNGYHLLVPLDLPNDDASRDACQAFLADLDARLGGDAARIDRSVYNAARFVRLHGTLNCKGDDTPERPHRRSGILRVAEDVDDEGVARRNGEVIVAHVAGVLARQQAERKAHAAALRRLRTNEQARDRQSIERRAVSYLATIPGAVSGQGGHGETFWAARVLARGFLLDPETALDLLMSEYNPRCRPPWTKEELQHKVEDAISKPFNHPPGWLLEQECRPQNDGRFASGGQEVGGSTAAESPPGTAGNLHALEAPDDPFRLARGLLAEDAVGGAAVVALWRDEWLTHRGYVWEHAEESSIKNRLRRHAKRWFDNLHAAAVDAWHKRGQRDESGKECPAPQPMKVTSSRVGDAFGALQALAEIEAGPPAWLGTEQPFDPRQAIAFTNGVLSVADWLAGRFRMVEPTPRFWSRAACDYAFDPKAPEPRRWLDFLRKTWPDDDESVRLLQEWAGYLLLADNRHQKAMLLIGPPRAGKGNVLGTLKGLVGERSCASVDLAGLGGPFALQGMIGRTSCLIEDARLDGRADINVVKSRLLTITGGGGIDINRKNLPVLHLTLPLRFTIATNESPRILDASGAMATRFLILKFVTSHVGHEDPTLLPAFLSELPGICLWALDGLARLRERGRFVEPRASADLRQQFQELTSPVRAFVAERCVVSPSAVEKKGDLSRAYIQWCKATGKAEPDDSVFFRDLMAAYPTLTTFRPREGGGRITCVKGIAVNCQDEADEPGADGRRPT